MIAEATAWALVDLGCGAAAEFGKIGRAGGLDAIHPLTPAGFHRGLTALRELSAV